MSQQEMITSALVSHKGISDSLALSPASVSFYFFYFGAQARQ